MACRLCKQNKPLLKSHIFPEWLHGPLYANKRRFFDLRTFELKRRGTPPKVIYEELLCLECEQQFNKWEGYAHEVFFGNDPSIKIRDCGDRFDLTGLEYAPFKLFQMSLIWRAATSSSPEVPTIYLGPHTERLREMLKRERPGESREYGALLMFPSPSIQKVMEHFFEPPKRLSGRIQGHTAYKAVFGGLFWTFFVSNHSEMLPDEMFFARNGRLPVFKYELPTTGFIGEFESYLSSLDPLDDQK